MIEFHRKHHNKTMTAEELIVDFIQVQRKMPRHTRDTKEQLNRLTAIVAKLASRLSDSEVLELVDGEADLVIRKDPVNPVPFPDAQTLELRRDEPQA